MISMCKLDIIEILQHTILNLGACPHPTSSELHMLETLWHVFIDSDLFSAFISIRFLHTNPPELRSLISGISHSLWQFGLFQSHFVTFHVPSCPLPHLFAKGPFCQIDPTLHLLKKINHHAIIFSHEGFLNKWRKSRVGHLACGEYIHSLRDPCIFWSWEERLSVHIYAVVRWSNQRLLPKSSYPSLWYDVDTCPQRIEWPFPDSESRYMYALAQGMCCKQLSYPWIRKNSSLLSQFLTSSRHSTSETEFSWVWSYDYWGLMC